MDHIIIEHRLSPAKLDVLYVEDWPTWSKEVSEFDWVYDKTETCYIVEGRAIVTPENGEPVPIESGDMVTFPKGMKCRWEIIEDLEKHYNIE